jgi:hypothetical protein
LRENIVIAAAAIAVLGLIAFAVFEAKRHSDAEAFEKIGAGASKQDVIELLGEPAEVRNCFRTDRCKDVLVYYSFMERRGYAFDDEGKLIDKYYNVSH